MTPLQAQIVATEADLHAAHVNLAHAIENRADTAVRADAEWRVVKLMGQLDRLRARERAT